MRYVIGAVGVVFLVLWATGAMPVEVLGPWFVIGILALAAFRGAGQHNRVSSLRRTLFFNESLISYKETLDDDLRRPKGEEDLA